MLISHIASPVYLTLGLSFYFLPGLQFIHSTKHVIDHFQGPMGVQFHRSFFKLKALLKSGMWRVSAGGITKEICKQVCLLFIT